MSASTPTTSTSTVNPAIAFLVQDPLSSSDSSENEDDAFDDSSSSPDTDSDISMDADASDSDDDASASDSSSNMLDELPPPITQRSKLLPQFSTTPGCTIETWALDPSNAQNAEDDAYIAMRRGEMEREEEEARKRMRKEVGSGVGEEGVEALTI